MCGDVEQTADLEPLQQVSELSTITFLPALGLYIALGWHHCPCVSLPATAQSSLKTPVQAQGGTQPGRLY